MRRSRRRKAKPLWFPPLGSPFAIGDDTTVWGGVTFKLDVPGSGAIAFTEIPLTFDFGQEALLADAQTAQTIPSLADLQGSAWRLRRVVGEFNATYHIHDSGVLDPDQVAHPGVAFAAGLMVRKVNEFSTAQTNVDVWNRDDYDDPWIWRRSWLLGQGARFLRQVIPRGDVGGTLIAMKDFPASGVVAPAGLDIHAMWARFPNTTADYGSALTGGHIDQKTNRIIGPEDRLFMHLAVKSMPVASDPLFTNDNSFVGGAWDLRYLGFLARATNRRNASR